MEETQQEERPARITSSIISNEEEVFTEETLQISTEESKTRTLEYSSEKFLIFSRIVDKSCFITRVELDNGFKKFYFVRDPKLLNTIIIGIINRCESGK